MPRYIIEDRHLKDPQSKGNHLFAYCPFHEDENTPNLSIFENRTRYKCHACDEGGTAYDFLKRTNQLPAKEASRGRPKAIQESHVKYAHEALLKNKEMMAHLLRKRGWKLEIIKKYKLGIKNGLITIPIRNQTNNLINIRLYDVMHKTDVKFMSWAKGLGSLITLFPPEALKKNDILLCEGEPDAILARQMGFNAAAFTGGTGSIKNNHLAVLLEKNVDIVFDIDVAGRKAAIRISRFLSRICPKVKNVELPITEPKNGDLTDFFAKTKDGVQVLKSLIKETEPRIMTVAERDAISKMKPRDMNLEEAALAINVQCKQRFRAIVAGKDTEPYLIPKTLLIQCSTANNNKLCKICNLEKEDEITIELGTYDPEVLQIVGSSEYQARGIYKKMAGIPKRCTSWIATPVQSQNVEDILMIPEIDHDSEAGRPYVSRRGILLNKMIDTNRPYVFTGWTVPNPQTHHVVHLLEDAEPTLTTIDSFKTSSDIKKSLEIFIPDKGQSILEKIDEIHQDFEDNVTHIWQRRDMMMAVDLVFHSALKFSFQGDKVRRGWVEVLVVGDTRCGKSETALQMQHHYRAGEMVSSENLSFAGLVGGINIVGSRKYITWGKLPLNDGGLVILDEFSGMEVEDIGRLSAIRASGVAEITKIQTEKTMARVRLLILSNPRKLTVSAYSMGVLAVQDLIGKAEDIARFDLAITLASNEIKPEEINQKRNKRVPHVYTSQACSNRVRWAWSRKPDQIVFQSDAEDLILWSANVQSKHFHPAIPLVEPSEQRIKIARLSVALAAMTYSTKTGREIIITDKHVEAAFNVMEASYRKPSMGYHHFSAARFREETISNKDRVENKMMSLGLEIMEYFLDKAYIQLQDLEDWTGGERADARKLASFLVKNRCLKRPYSNYMKTTPFKQLLIRLTGKVKSNPELIKDAQRAIKEDEEDENSWWGNK